ncbi:MAG: dihydrofolate reductase [Erysipelotrichaceae bacterium]|nr:dihydrofolate reductase [Erysipelotrichaceae bacterium]
MLALIVAMDPNQGIGIRSFLPWRIKEDLQLFKRTTEHHTIVMGETTFLGLPKPLPNRHTIVISRNPDLKFDHLDVSVEHDLYALFDRFQHSEEVVYICGGASIYQQALPYVQKLCISHVKKNYEVDTWFPPINWSMFEMVKEVEYDEFIYREYLRKD